MLYHLFKYLDQYMDIPGAGLFQYISFRAAFALILSLLISAVLGKRLIARLRRLQVGDTIRELWLAAQMEKT